MQASCGPPTPVNAAALAFLRSTPTSMHIAVMQGAGMLCAALLCLALWPIIMHAADDIGVQFPRHVSHYNPDWKSLTSRPHPKVKRPLVQNPHSSCFF